MGLALAAVAVLVFVALGLWWRRPAAPARPVVVIDGSNVMHWADGTPKIEAVRAVINDVAARGFQPLVYFDANVGYKLIGQHADAARLAQWLKLKARQVEVVPSGTPADPWLIERAIALDARVVSNDRFQDWRGDYPALRRKGFLVGGRLKGAAAELRF